MRRILAMAIWLVAGIHQAAAQEGSPRIPEALGPAPLEQILSTLRKEYKIRLAYDPDAVAGIESGSSGAGMMATEALDALLTGTGLGWKRVRNTLVIFQDTRSPELKLASTGSQRDAWSAIIADSETGEGLPYALARVSDREVGVVADEYGKLVIADLASDSCVVTIYYTGFQPRSFRLNSTWASRKVITLDPAEVSLPRAEVTGFRTPLLEPGEAVGMQSLQPQSLTAISTNGETDILRGAQLLPGISGTTESSSGLIIRGSDSDQALVQFDDFTIYHLDHFFGNFSAINPDMVKQVRVSKGFTDAASGGRAGGMVRITGKEGNRMRPSASLNLGTLSAGFMAETPVGSRGSFIIAGRRSYMDLAPTPAFRSLYTTAYNQAGAAAKEEDLFAGENRPDFAYQDLTAKWSWRGVGSGRVSVSAYLGRDKLSQSYRLVNESGGLKASYADQSLWGNTGVGLRWQREKKAGAPVLISLGWSRYQSNFFSADSIVSVTTGLPSKLLRDESFLLNDANLRLEKGFRSGRWNMRSGLHLNGTALEGRDNANLKSGQGSAIISSFYLQSEGSFGKLVLRPGLRWSHYSIHNKGYPEWRLSSSWKATGNLEIKAGIHRVHQFIHRLRQQSLGMNHSDVWIWSASETVPVLRTDQVSAGFTYRKGHWTIDAEGYMKNNAGTFEYVPQLLDDFVPGDSLLTGSGKTRGIDMLVGFREKGHHAWLAYSFMVTANRFAELGSRDLPEWFDQRHEWKGTYQWNVGHWELALTGVFGTGRPYTPLLGTFMIPLQQGDIAQGPLFGPLYAGRLPAYHRIDMAVAWNQCSRSSCYTIRASLFNLYNRRNIRDIRYSGLPADQGMLVVLAEQIRMTGFIPSLQLQIKW